MAGNSNSNSNSNSNRNGNGNGRVPPGFRFHPTDEELVNYYLRKKVKMEAFDLDVIRDVDLNKLEPWDLHERCRIDTAQQTDWYFFSHKDKKYPTGTRTNRATAAGFWKATGRDKAVHASPHRGRIGMRKTLVFYRGRAPHGQKTDWIMHEYRLLSNDDEVEDQHQNSYASEDCWVVCRVFKKRIHHQKTAVPSNPSIMMLASEEEQSSLVSENPSLDQNFNNFQVQTISSDPTISCGHKTLFCKIEEDYEDVMPKGPFLHMPQLESPKSNTNNNTSFLDIDYYQRRSLTSVEPSYCKRSDVFPSSLALPDMPILDTSSYTKSLIFEGDENLVDYDRWDVLDNLSNDTRPYHIPSTDLCTTLLSNNCDADIWKALL